MPHPLDPVRQLPRPAEVHAHIGRLLVELRFARRLFKLTRAADLITQAAERGLHLTTADHLPVPGTVKEVSRG